MADLKISQLTGATTPLAGAEVVPLVQSSATKKVSVANLTAGRSVEVDRLGVKTASPATDIHVQNTTELRAVVTASSNIIQLWKDAGASYAVAFGLNKPGAALGSQFKVSYTTGGAWIDGYTLDSSGNLKIDTGNLVQGTAAKGVNFTANTPAAGMTSQLLNWYEEGTWTPAYSSSGATFSYTVQTGWYRRIGSLVTVGFTLEASASGTLTNSLSITGLPFASKNAANTYGCVATGYTTFTEAATGQVGSNDTTIAMYRDNNSGNSATPTTTGLSGGSKYWIGVMSYTAA